MNSHQSGKLDTAGNMLVFVKLYTAVLAQLALALLLYGIPFLLLTGMCVFLLMLYVHFLDRQALKKRI